MNKSFLVALALAGSLMAGDGRGAQRYDVVLRGGLVMDPESGLQAPRNLGLRAGKVAAISEAPLTGDRVIDVRGRVVAPGFVDVHSHAQSLLGGRVQAFDGVTTAIESEIGQFPVAAAYTDALTPGRAIHYGYTVAWDLIRDSVLGGASPDGTLRGRAASRAKAAQTIGRAATPEERQKILQLLERSIDEGAVGIGLALGYIPGATPEEVQEVSQLAARKGVTVFVHMRSGVSDFAATEEVIANAATTGAHWHIMHVYWDSDEQLDMLARAMRAGLPITPDTKGWLSSSTFLGAPFLSAAALRASGDSPNDILYYGRRIASDEELEQLRARDPGALIVALEKYDDTVDLHKREETARRLKTPGWVLATDAMPWTTPQSQPVPATTWPLPRNAWAHPRSAATYSRVIQEYVRNWKLVSLMDVLRASSLNPARELEQSVPQLHDKGRIRVGADADIIVFDPEKVAAMATVEQPAALSAGMEYVLVAGTLLIDKGRLNTAVFPGKAIRRQ
ncbi:MAG: amidohydrolase family protein [Proteobacteria bacterium]|nr:amidohydrolase family protein [Pseudomonadota bacterium]